MRTDAIRHLSLVMGLLVMLLMAAALVAGQAGASLHPTAFADGGYRDVQLLGERGPGIVTVEFPVWPLNVHVDPELSRRAVEAAAAVVADLTELP